MTGDLRAHAALSRFAPLFWFRSPVERHPRLGHVQIAHLGWRFAEPHDEFKAVFEAVARDAPRHVEWRFKAAKNWLIRPVRLAEESARNGDDFGEAQVTVTKDQDFCLLAAKDMDLILQAIEDAAP
ncbi:hypothetical protein [Streptomyces sp. NBC_00105]|uniref:hypothetical protein n=1 Tax=unclassified Streptomyces TaxID=2593676 RepID=UPI0028875A7A|nr:hypothetical protein [Streptomyces sp. DSM 41633]